MQIQFRNYYTLEHSEINPNKFTSKTLVNIIYVFKIIYA